MREGTVCEIFVSFSGICYVERLDHGLGRGKAGLTLFD